MKTQKEYLTTYNSDEKKCNLYYGKKFFINKTIITSFIYHPEFSSYLEYKFHFGELIENNDKTEKLLLPFEDTDLTAELLKFCPREKQQKGYFFIEVFDQEKKLPAYYSILHLNPDLGLDKLKNNQENLKDFRAYYNYHLEKFVEKEIIDYSVKANFDKYLYRINDFIQNDKNGKHDNNPFPVGYKPFENQYIYAYRNKEDFFSEFLELLNNDLNNKKTNSLYYFLFDVLSSYISEKNDFCICKNCKKLFRVTDRMSPKRKYCDPSLCKTASNKREERLEKHIKPQKI